MTRTIKQQLKGIAASLYNSYAQVFFSNHKGFGIVLLLASFLNPQAGISGLIAVAVTNLAAYLIGLNKKSIVQGDLAFNSALTGLGLGVFYNFNTAFFFVLVFASLLTLFLTVQLSGWLGKYRLPYLSFPFLFATWLVSLASRQFKGLEISLSGVYKYNEVYLLGGGNLLQAHMWFTNLPLPESLLIYFQSLGAIFFQYTVYAGILIAIGLLIASRISFVLSLIGFYSAFYYYQIIGADLGELNYGYIGFNYILTAIAVGGFFVIPSFYSYLWVMLLTPVISLFVTGTSAVLAMFQLSAYSLPFNMVVILFLYTLLLRDRNFNKPFLVEVQEYSPEANLYSYLNYVKRFRDQREISLSLPVKGWWSVNQGYDGKHTHKDEWKHALDLVILNDEKEFRNGGNKLEDYYCYGQPVLAPADGVVETIVNNVEDNMVGDVNLKENWGNTIVIRHSNSLFTQLSHLKINTFRVVTGQKVKAGEILALLGNSGRSAYPHLHFQVQAYPYIGSKTIEYPMANYLLKASISKSILRQNTIPQEGDTIEKLETDESMRKAFHFIPGQEFRWKSESHDTLPQNNHKWEVQSDIYGNTFIECADSGAQAYFKATHNEMYFTHFKGSKRTALYYFYLAAYKVLFGYNKDLVIKDLLPTQNRPNVFLSSLQDILAPFYRFEKSQYTMRYLKRESFFDESVISLESEYRKLLFGKTIRTSTFQLRIEPAGIKEIIVQPLGETAVRIIRIEHRD